MDAKLWEDYPCNAEFVDRLAKLPLLYQPGTHVGLQPLHRRARTPRRGRLAADVRRVPHRAHLHAARHARHRLLRGRCREAGAHRGAVPQRPVDRRRRRAQRSSRGPEVGVGRRRARQHHDGLRALPPDAAERREPQRQAPAEPQDRRVHDRRSHGRRRRCRGRCICPARASASAWASRCGRTRACPRSPARVGEYNWGGAAGTYFWVDPKEELFVVYMMQSPKQRVGVRALLKDMVYGAVDRAPRGSRRGRAESALPRRPRRQPAPPRLAQGAAPREGGGARRAPPSWPPPRTPPSATRCALQEDVGLLGITDGEMRRKSWHMDFLTQLCGLVERGQGAARDLPRASRRDVLHAPRPGASPRASRGPGRSSWTAFRFLRASVSLAHAKLTLPSPCMLYSQVGRANIDRAVYPDLDAFVEDTAAAVPGRDRRSLRGRLPVPPARRREPGLSLRRGHAGGGAGARRRPRRAAGAVGEADPAPRCATSPRT